MTKINCPTAAEIIATEYPEQGFWIGPAILPHQGRLAIVGKTGVGKSFIVQHIVKCLATGYPLFNAIRRKKDENRGAPLFPILTPAERIMSLDFEFGEAMRQPRIKPLFVSTNAGERVRYPRETQFLGLQNHESACNFDNLKGIVSEHRPQILIIDPFSSSHQYDENTSDIKPALMHMDFLIKNYDLSVIVAIHQSTKETRNKDGHVVSKDAMEAARGWSGLMDWFDTQIQIEERRAPDEDRLHLKIRFGKVRHGAKLQGRNLDIIPSTMDVLWNPEEE